MVNRNYSRGRTFEYRIKKHYEKLGYHVVRSYASKGAADLYAMKVCHSCGNCVSTSLILIQAKNYPIKKLPTLEKEALLLMGKVTGGKCLLAKNVNHRLIFEEVKE